MVEDFRRDPLVFHNRFPVRTGAEILAAMRSVGRDMESLRTPLLILHGTGDCICDVEGSRQLHARAARPTRRYGSTPGCITISSTSRSVRRCWPTCWRGSTHAGQRRIALWKSATGSASAAVERRGSRPLPARHDATSSNPKALAKPVAHHFSPFRQCHPPTTNKDLRRYLRLFHNLRAVPI